MTSEQAEHTYTSCFERLFELFCAGLSNVDGGEADKLREAIDPLIDLLDEEAIARIEMLSIESLERFDKIRCDVGELEISDGAVAITCAKCGRNVPVVSGFAQEHADPRKG